MSVDWGYDWGDPNKAPSQRKKKSGKKRKSGSRSSSSKTYFCEHCGVRHSKNSRIGRDHLGGVSKRRKSKQSLKKTTKREKKKIEKRIKAFEKKVANREKGKAALKSAATKLGRGGKRAAGSYAGLVKTAMSRDEWERYKEMKARQAVVSEKGRRQQRGEEDIPDKTGPTRSKRLGGSGGSRFSFRRKKKRDGL